MLVYIYRLLNRYVGKKMDTQGQLLAIEFNVFSNSRYSQTLILCHLATMPPSLLYHFWSSPTKFNRKYIYYATTYPRYYATWGTVLQCINETINATNETITRLWNGKSIQYVHVICSLKLSTVAQPKTLRNRQLAHVLSADFMQFVV